MQGHLLKTSAAAIAALFAACARAETNMWDTQWFDVRPRTPLSEVFEQLSTNENGTVYRRLSELEKAPAALSNLVVDATGEMQGALSMDIADARAQASAAAEAATNYTSAAVSNLSEGVAETYIAKDDFGYFFEDMLDGGMWDLFYDKSEDILDWIDEERQRYYRVDEDIRVTNKVVDVYMDDPEHRFQVQHEGSGLSVSYEGVVVKGPVTAYRNEASDTIWDLNRADEVSLPDRTWLRNSAVATLGDLESRVAVASGAATNLTAAGLRVMSRAVPGAFWDGSQQGVRKDVTPHIEFGWPDPYSVIGAIGVGGGLGDGHGNEDVARPWYAYGYETNAHWLAFYDEVVGATNALLSEVRTKTDMRVYETIYSDWTFSDGQTRDVVIGNDEAASAVTPWWIAGKDNADRPEVWFSTREEAEACTEFTYVADSDGVRKSIVATRGSSVAATGDRLATTNELARFLPKGYLETNYWRVAEMLDVDGMKTRSSVIHLASDGWTELGPSANPNRAFAVYTTDGAKEEIAQAVQSATNHIGQALDKIVNGEVIVGAAWSAETAVGAGFASRLNSKSEQERYDADDLIAIATNYTNRAVNKSVDVPETAADKGVTFTDKYGDDQNAAVQIGLNAKAAVSEEALVNAAAGTVVRSVSVAIGANADATMPSANSVKNQAVAIGYCAQAKESNAIAIGSGAQHTGETAETGNAAVASAATSIAIGYDAKATAQGATAVGKSAKARAVNAVQLGTGINTTKSSLQFMGTTVVKDGKVQYDVGEAVAAAKEALLTNGVPVMTFTEDDEKKVTRFSAEKNGEAYQHTVVVMKNPDADTPFGFAPDLEIYRASTVDRKIDAVSNLVTGAAADVSSATNALLELIGYTNVWFEDDDQEKPVTNAWDYGMVRHANAAYGLYMDGDYRSGDSILSVLRNQYDVVKDAVEDNIAVFGGDEELRDSGISIHSISTSDQVALAVGSVRTNGTFTTVLKGIEAGMIGVTRGPAWVRDDGAVFMWSDKGYADGAVVWTDVPDTSAYSSGARLYAWDGGWNYYPSSSTRTSFSTVTQPGTAERLTFIGGKQSNPLTNEFVRGDQLLYAQEIGEMVSKRTLAATNALAASMASAFAEAFTNGHYETEWLVWTNGVAAAGWTVWENPNPNAESAEFSYRLYVGRQEDFDSDSGVFFGYGRLDEFTADEAHTSLDVSATYLDLTSDDDVRAVRVRRFVSDYGFAMTNDVAYAVSTNNPAFVAAVLGVPLVGQDSDDLSELASYGGYGTAGAAILALIAGLAAMRRRVAALEAKTSFTFETATIENNSVSLADRKVTTVRPASANDLSTVSLPDGADGANECVLRLDLTSCQTAPDIQWTNADTFESEDGTFPQPVAGVLNIYMFSETASGTYFVERKTAKAVAS